MSSSFLHFIRPPCTASGFAVGVLVGFTGASGGAVTTPLLVLLFGIYSATAVGTDLLYAGLTKPKPRLTAGSNHVREEDRLSELRGLSLRDESLLPFTARHGRGEERDHR